MKCEGYISFLSEQVIPCENDECTVESFRIRVLLDTTANGKLDWKIDRVTPSCPSCGMPNYSGRVVE